MIFVNGRFLSQPITGVQRFARELLQSLDEILQEKSIGSKKITITCLVPFDVQNQDLPNWENIQISQVGKFSGNVWEQIDLPFFSRKGLLINLCNIGPLFHFNQIVVFHDASVFAVPAAYSFAFKVKYRLIMWVLGRSAKQILTVSEFSKKELARYLHINEKRLKVISEGCEHILQTKPDDSILKEKGLVNKRFVLAVGSSSAHKNLARVEEAIKADSKNSFFLAIAGGSFSKVFADTQHFDNPNILHLGFVSDGQLRALYEHAAGFIFPSLYEGFGLPPLEAMACGCPVICSNRASLPEICGDAASYFDPLNVEEIDILINQLVNDSSLRDSLKQKGFQKAKQFTWKKSAQVYFKILKEYLPS